MRILHLIYTHGVAGAEKYLKHLLPGLSQYGIKCDLIVVCPPKMADVLKVYVREVEQLGIRTTLIVATKTSVIATAWKINKYLRTNGINIVHSHLFNSDIIAALLKSLFFRDLYIISTKHGYLEDFFQKYEPGKKIRPGGLYYWITKYTFRKINVNIATSRAIADLYYDIGLADEPYAYIHHGVKIEDFNKDEYRKECRRANLQLISVGRLELIKGHRYLIDAMATVAEVFPDIKLLIIGAGIEKENCIKQVEALGLQNNVEFLGFKPHPYSYIAHSDIVVQTSIFESFGLVFIEAFALQKPVVAFNTPAGNEIMENGQTALLVEKGDSKALAEKIIYLLKNPDERERIIKNAYEKYLKEFTTEVMVKRMADWYHRLPQQQQ